MASLQRRRRLVVRCAGSAWGRSSSGRPPPRPRLRLPASSASPSALRSDLCLEPPTDVPRALLQLLGSQAVRPGHDLPRRRVRPILIFRRGSWSWSSSRVTLRVPQVYSSPPVSVPHRQGPPSPRDAPVPAPGRTARRRAGRGGLSARPSLLGPSPRTVPALALMTVFLVLSPPPDLAAVVRAPASGRAPAACVRADLLSDRAVPTSPPARAPNKGGGPRASRPLSRRRPLASRCGPFPEQEGLYSRAARVGQASSGHVVSP